MPTSSKFGAFLSNCGAKLDLTEPNPAYLESSPNISNYLNAYPNLLLTGLLLHFIIGAARQERREFAQMLLN